MIRASCISNGKYPLPLRINSRSSTFLASTSQAISSVSTLQAQDGSQLVIRDRMGHVVQSVVELSAARNGKQIQLSIDSSIQYSVFSALEQAVVNSQAKAGAAIVVDAHTGEVLALANYPTYDPNDRAVLTGEQLRHRWM